MCGSVPEFDYSPCAQLSRMGVLPPVDMKSYLSCDDVVVDTSDPIPATTKQAGSAPKLNVNISKDVFMPENESGHDKPSTWKKWAAGALGLYLGGLVLSRGKVNPLQWGASIKGTFNTVKSWVCKWFH